MKKTLLAFVLLLSTNLLSAQTGFFRNLPSGLIVYGMSPSGNYICGASGFTGFLYKTADSTLINIGGVVAYDVTDLAVAAGNVDTAIGSVSAEMAAIYNGGVWTPLPGPPGGAVTTGTGSYSDAFGISDNGETVCGMYWQSASNTNAFIYNTTAGYTVLQDVGSSAKATCISGNGQVAAGWWQANNRIPVRWNPTSSTMGAVGECAGTNTTGSYIASYDNPSFATVPTLWDSAANSMVTLPLPSTATDGRALAVSDNGTTVGYYSDGTAQRGFIYIPGIGTQDLASFLVSLGISNVLNPNYPAAISRDGRYIAGNTFGGFPRPPGYFIDLGSAPTAVTGVKNDFHNVTVFPNPSKEQATVSFDLTHDGTAGLVIRDMKGNQVRTFETVRLGTGKQQLIWDLTSDSGDRVAPGYYLGNLTYGNKATVVFILVQ